MPLDFRFRIHGSSRENSYEASRIDMSERGPFLPSFPAHDDEGPVGSGPHLR